MVRVLYQSPDGEHHRTALMSEHAAELVARRLLESGEALAARLEADGERSPLVKRQSNHIASGDTERRRQTVAKLGAFLTALCQGRHLD
jgi:hypothetical protein